MAKIDGSRQKYIKMILKRRRINESVCSDSEESNSMERKEESASE